MDRALADGLLPRAGQITLITGASGAGKSTLLRKAVRSCRGLRVIDLSRLRLPRREIVDCFGDLPLQRLLPLLSAVGLAEAWSYLRTPAELSDGQRWRLRVAIGLWRAGCCGAGSRKRRASSPAKRENDALRLLVADEFAAMLDRVTAAIVARALRRAVSSSPTLAAIVATSHDDLSAALQPDIIARCDFGSMHVSRPAFNGGSSAAL